MGLTKPYYFLDESLPHMTPGTIPFHLASKLSSGLTTGVNNKPAPSVDTKIQRPSSHLCKQKLSYLLVSEILEFRYSSAEYPIWPETINWSIPSAIVTPSWSNPVNKNRIRVEKNKKKIQKTVGWNENPLTMSVKWKILTA